MAQQTAPPDVKTPIVIYVAGPYTARRDTCLGCLGPIGEEARRCPHVVRSTPKEGDVQLEPGATCTMPDVERRGRNVAEADFAGRIIARLGHVPFVPHKMTFDWERDPVLLYPDFIRIDDEWLKRSEAILYGAPSSGADRELKLAEYNGLDVFRSVLEIPTVVGYSRDAAFQTADQRPCGAPPQRIPYEGDGWK